MAKKPKAKKSKSKPSSYVCPACGSTAGFEIEALVTVALTETGDGIETEPVGANHEWDDNSWMYCVACEHKNKVRKFVRPLASEKEAK